MNGGFSLQEKNFDLITEYIVMGSEFKSWNNDPNFKLNALYFKFTKPYKVQVDFWGEMPVYKRCRSSFFMHLSRGTLGGISLKNQAYTPGDCGTGLSLGRTSVLEYTFFG